MLFRSEWHTLLVARGACVRLRWAFSAQPFEPDAGNPAVGKLVCNWYDSCLTALAFLWVSVFFSTFEQQGADMAVVLNGKNMDITEGMTLLDLLESKDISPETVVVEHNKEIVPADMFATTALNDGDHLEVLRFVGGG